MPVRSIDVRFNRQHNILRFQLNTRSPKYVDKMVKSRGYALVTVDTRGSGASFGKRPFDLAPAEVADHQEVLEWVIAQPWCNGKVGTLLLCERVQALTQCFACEADRTLL